MSWKSAAKTNQKTHRERHQPESRKHLGVLEKKKDYKLRAKHYNETRESLKFFKRVALDKNPNEFYHHMINSKIKDGVHNEKAKADEELTEDQLKLMRQQDTRYVNMKHQIEQKKIQRLQANLHMIDAANEVPNQHKFFVDNEEELKNFDICKRLETHESLLGRKTNRLRVSDLEKLNIDQIDSATLERMNKEKSKAYRELEKRIERERDLAVVKTRMEQRLKKKSKAVSELLDFEDYNDNDHPPKQTQRIVYTRKR